MPSRFKDLADIVRDQATALLTDPERAPAIAKAIHQRFALSDDYDSDGPDGLQLFVMGILSEREAKWLDGVIDADDRNVGYATTGALMVTGASLVPGRCSRMCQILWKLVVSLRLPAMVSATLRSSHGRSINLRPHFLG